MIVSQLRKPIKSKFTQVCYFKHMLGYTKWEYWSLTITKSVQMPLSIFTQFLVAILLFCMYFSCCYIERFHCTIFTLLRSLVNKFHAHCAFRLLYQSLFHYFVGIFLLLFNFLICLCKSPDTQGLKAISRCGLQLFFFQRLLPRS